MSILKLQKLILISNFLLRSKLSLFCFYVFSLIYLWSYAIIPFHDHDSVIYALRGNMLFDGIPIESLPFDHKPLGINLIYGFFGYFIKYGHGQSLIISITFNVLFILAAYNLLDSLIKRTEVRRGQVFTLLTIFLVVFQSPFVGLSGNSETLANFFILVSLTFLFDSSKKNPLRLVFLSGFFAVISISINLLSAVILSLPSLYLLIQLKENRSKFFLFYCLGSLLSLIMFIFLFLNMGDFKSYFYDVFNFFQVYGDRTQEDKLKSFLYFFRGLIIFIPILISSIYISNQISEKLGVLVFTLLLWVVSAFFSCLISGNDLVHYLSFLVAPLTILSCIVFINLDSQKRALVFLVPLVYCMTYMSTEVYDNFRKDKVFEIVYPQMKKISEIVEDKKMLSIRIGHVPFYLTNMHPTQKYLFPQLANLLESSNEDVHWSGVLKDYEFAIVPKELCIKKELPMTCNALNDSYIVVFKSGNLEIYGKSFISSFFLYKKT